ncbi:HD domain-containing protein [Aquipuribacter sp. MA13-6]|uniref:HD domain-containing protein n=1 Tax=unclassified Aquipuribacter TaxID=2635084 RepID=UPI003EEFAE02
MSPPDVTPRHPLVPVLLRLGAAPGPAEQVQVDLLGRWSEPHRTYHDRRHLEEVLERVEQLSAHAEDADLVRCAAWWHDAVHDGRAGDDERASAALAHEQLVSLGVAGRHVRAVTDLVLVTISHDPGDPAEPDAAVLCDADLGILATDRSRYDEYAADVRQEYGHVPDELFAAGRAAVLRRLLSHRHLFRTPTATAWEQTARDNLSRELDGLGAPQR